MNIVWALDELAKFIEETTMSYPPSNPGIVDLTGRKVTRADEDTITKRAQIVEQILDRVIPDWRTIDSKVKVNRWMRHRDAAIRAKAALERQEEVESQLGENAPKLSAADLHSWVWSGAKSLWQSGHFRSAVEDALKKVNAEVQNKVRRRDISETKLFQESFSENAPHPGKPRLRRMVNDGSDTYRSLQRGAMALAEGIYAGIRNPLNHEAPAELSEQVALEYLAALSVLARWVDEATVEEAP